MTSSASIPIAVALLAAVILAGCGASSAGSVAYKALRAARRASACIRANGVPNYPEPQLVSRTISFPFTHAINPVTPAVQAAVQKCGAQNEQRVEETRSRITLARCVRTHGVPNFPYPTAQGRVSPAMVRAHGINPQSPTVARAVARCLPAWLRPQPLPDQRSHSPEHAR
jgi:hypothetical protein